MKKRLGIVGAAMGYGTRVSETEQGPDAAYRSSLLRNIANLGYEASWDDTITVGHFPGIQPGTIEAMPLIQDFDMRLGRAVSDVLARENFPIVIGGDHSIAVGTWSGVTHTLGMEGNFGLIWLDAHMDSHTPLTTPSNCIHGMPLASLMGHGDEALTKLISPHPKLNPQHVVLIGTRSFEEGEQKFLERLNVRIMYQDEVLERGFQACFDEALKIAQHNTKGFGVSLDLDMFDPRLVPGVGVPEPDGVHPQDAIQTLRGLINNPHLKAFEVVEYNPHLDRDDLTLQALQDVIDSVLHV